MSLAISGCGSGSPDDRPDLGTVTGTVTMNGEPLPGVEVTFVPEEGRPSVGRTESDGTYELTYIRDIKGAKIGNHQVRIHTIHETTSDRDGGEPPEETIPDRYNTETTLTAEVTAGDNKIDFPLESKQ